MLGFPTIAEGPVVTPVALTQASAAFGKTALVDNVTSLQTGSVFSLQLITKLEETYAQLYNPALSSLLVTT
jgi:ABC-type transporter Mla maintaining outer membrane lipid asymmetry permease subunit MlaE